MDVACELIPITFAALKHILRRRASEFGPPIYHSGGEPRYRNGLLVDYEGGAAHRMLTESDCLKVREMVTQTRAWGEARPKPAYGSNGRPLSDFGLSRGKGRGRHPAKVMDLLMADEVEDVG